MMTVKKIDDYYVVMQGTKNLGMKYYEIDDAINAIEKILSGKIIPTFQEEQNRNPKYTNIPTAEEIRITVKKKNKK